MKIRQKLILGFVGIALLVGVVAIISVLQNKKLQYIAEEEVYRSISHLDNVWRLMEAQEHQEIAANNYLFLGADLKARRADYFYEKERLEKIYQKYRKEACEHVKPQIEKYYENIKIYNAKTEEAFELHRQGADPELIKERIKEANKFAETAHEDALEPIIEHVYKKHLAPAREDIAKGISRTTNILIISGVIAVFLAMSLGLSISRSISVPIIKLKNATVEIGKGKLDTKIEIKSNDEIGQLAKAFDNMTQNLKRTTTSISVLEKEITERKRAEEKIKELAKFPSENPNPILKISKDCEILYANNAGSSILEAWGCKEGQRLQAPQCKLIEEVLSTSKAVTFELACRDQVFSVTMAPVVKSGYVNVYGLDVTELKLSKEHLKQAREQAKVKAQFVSTVSHELRTPLTTMKEAVNIVLDGVAGEINNKQRHFLDIAKRNIDRLARFINDVLDFQKLEAGKMEVNMQRNDIDVVVEETIETMASAANEKGLELTARLDETMPMVNFDRDRIIQVLVNLVDNAIKFTEKGNITIATTKADNTVRISVRDTGAGIKNEDLPKLFHEFEQLSDSDERITGGSGLGLAISRRIIEEHNGKIWAESELGKGATFYFELPVQKKKTLAMAKKS